MTQCFWQLCTCPDTQPCGEHTGLDCGMFGDIRVTSASQVEDAITRDLGAAIAELERAPRELAAIRKRLEDKRRELERDQDDVRNEIEQAQDRAARRAVVAHIEDIVKRNQDLDAQLRRIAEEIELVGSSTSPTVSRLSRRCVIPFADSSGYCACYTRKQQTLAVLAQQIRTASGEVASARTEFNSRKSNVLMAVRVTFTLAGGWIIAAYVWLGVGIAALAQVLYAAIAVAIVLLVLVIYMGTAMLAVCSADERLARAFLAYYRVQLISTCKHPPQDAGSGADDSEGWWQKILDWAREPEKAPDHEPRPHRVG